MKKIFFFFLLIVSKESLLDLQQTQMSTAINRAQTRPTKLKKKLLFHTNTVEHAELVTGNEKTQDLVRVSQVGREEEFVRCVPHMKLQLF